MFSSPLFTVLLSFIFFQIKIGLLKGCLCLLLFGGVILIVKPPLIFPHNDTIQGNLTKDGFGTALIDDPHHPHSVGYYMGVALALGSALSGALNAIVVRHISNVLDSLAIMFYTGIGGIATALLVSSADGGISHMVEVIKKTDADLWLVLMIVSALGILGYFIHLCCQPQVHQCDIE